MADPTNKAHPLAGVAKSAEHRAKIAAANRGKHHSAETKAKMRASALGKPKTAETRARMSAARLGISFSDQTRAKMSASATLRAADPIQRERLRQIAASHPHPMLGKRHSDASRQKMSASRMGVPCPHARKVAYNGVSFRSSYEVRVAQALDRLGVKWTYEPQRFHLGKFTYLPDFYLPDAGAYWEVKGFYRYLDQQKVNTFRDQHPELPLVVFTERCIELLEAQVRAL